MFNPNICLSQEGDDPMDLECELEHIVVVLEGIIININFRSKYLILEEYMDFFNFMFAINK